MKKLIIATAILCVAGFANAGAVNWGSGAIQTPGEGGQLSGSRLTSGSGYTLSMYAWESLTASALSYEAGSLYSWFSSGASSTSDPFGGSLSAIAGSVNMGASATTATAYGKELTTAADVSVYGAVLFVLTDSATGEDMWYMENSGSILSKNGSTKATLANLSLNVGGGTSTTATTWSPVPEPTSGLLMLLGMAGLALRRKRT